MRLPPSVESRLSMTIDPPTKENKHYPAYERALGIFGKLRRAGTLRDLPYQLFLIELEEPNAFALPGGAIGVTSGLLDKLKTERGLAMVLAHEFGHHQHRHTVKRLGRALLFQTTLALLFGHTTHSMAEISIGMAELGYSRAQETEADEFGLSLFKNTYGDAEGALEFFELVEKEKLGSRRAWQTMFSTHPITTDRIAHLKALGAQ